MDRTFWLGVLVLFLAVFVRLDRNSVFFTGDAALGHAVSEALVGGELPLAGPPAARGGRHLGPYYFYFEGLMLLAGLGSVMAAVVVAAACKGAALLAVAESACWDCEPRRSIARGSAVALLLSGIWYWCIASPWHSNFMMLVGALALLSAFRVLRAPARDLPLFLFLANLSVLTHFASVPFIAALAVFVAFRCYCSRRASHWQLPNSRALTVSIIASAALWLPTLIYERSYEPNLQTFLASKLHSSRSTLGLFDASGIWLKSVAQFIGSATVGAGTPQYLMAMASVAAIAFGLFLAFRKADEGARWCIAAASAAVASYLFAIAKVPPPGELHYMHSCGGPIIYLAVIAMSALLRTSADFIRGTVSSRAIGIGSAALASLLLPIIAYSIGLNVFVLWISAPWPRHWTLAEAEAAARKLHDQSVENIVLGATAFARSGGSDDALFSLSGRPLWSHIHGARKLKELPSFRKQSAPSLPEANSVSN